ncbi:protein kinase domain-containing protein [Magnetospirillum fulvum]|nr:protein kinase [Magnetospirillum fulvum]
MHQIYHGFPLMIKVTDTIRQAHKIDVLHRDIRPSNIMVADIHGEIYAERNVVVLDFDLSWHNRGKDYKISENMTTMLGYLAPEQFTDSPSANRKAAEVDVYGLGMTLFYIISGRHPQANERTAATWNTALASISRNRFQTNWHSLGSRLSKLISDATLPDQKKRLDIASFQDRLKLIEMASKWPECNVVDVGFWIEEIAARSFGVDNISWDDDNIVAKLSPLPNWSISLQGREVARGAHIFLSVDYADVGVSQFRKITKYGPNKLSEIKRTLSSAGWKINEERTEYASYSARIFATIDVDLAISNVKNVCTALMALREKISSS